MSIKNSRKQLKFTVKNQAVISMSKNPTFHGRTKHIDIRIHFIQDLVSNESIILKYCNTNEQVADILIKSLPWDKLYFKLQLGVCNFESRGSFRKWFKVSCRNINVFLRSWMLLILFLYFLLYASILLLFFC